MSSAIILRVHKDLKRSILYGHVMVSGERPMQMNDDFRSNIWQPVRNFAYVVPELLHKGHVHLPQPFLGSVHFGRAYATADRCNDLASGMFPSVGRQYKLAAITAHPPKILGGVQQTRHCLVKIIDIIGLDERAVET